MIASRVVSAAVIAVAMTGAATAADLPDIVFEEPVPMPEPSRFDWTGFYFGGHAGVIANSVDPGFVGQKSMYENAFIGGAHVGYTAAIPMSIYGMSFVAGLEGDFDGSGYDQTRNYSYGPVNTSLDWTASVRSRIGVAFGQFWGTESILAYATGGTAFARIKAEVPGYVDSNTHIGWTVGGGVEAAVTRNITVRAEYMYTSYAQELYALGPVLSSVGIEARTNVVRGGVSYYF
jgi:opacity protein-like surface antigen